MDFETTIIQIKEKLDKLCETISKLREVILGDPTDESKPGFIIRLDRLEQSERLKNKVLWVMGCGILAMLGQLLFEII